MRPGSVCRLALIDRLVNDAARSWTMIVSTLGLVAACIGIVKSRVRGASRESRGTPVRRAKGYPVGPKPVMPGVGDLGKLFRFRPAAIWPSSIGQTRSSRPWITSSGHFSLAACSTRSKPDQRGRRRHRPRSSRRPAARSSGTAVHGFSKRCGPAFAARGTGPRRLHLRAWPLVAQLTVRDDRDARAERPPEQHEGLAGDRELLNSASRSSTSCVPIEHRPLASPCPGGPT